MPTINLSDIRNALNLGATSDASNANAAYIISPSGQIVANPGYLNGLQQQQLSTTVNGPTSGAIQGAVTQSTAQGIAAQAISNAAPISAATDTTLIDPTTGQPVPVGSSQNTLSGQTLVSQTQQQDIQALQQAQTLLSQIKSASAAVNTDNGQLGTSRSAAQAIKGLMLKASGDSNAAFLDNQAKSLLAPLASSVLGVNRFNPDEIQNLSLLVPNSSDTKQQAQAKIQHLQTLVTSREKELIPQTIASSQSSNYSVPQGTSIPSVNAGTQIPQSPTSFSPTATSQQFSPSAYSGQ